MVGQRDQKKGPKACGQPRFVMGKDVVIGSAHYECD